MQKGIKMNTYTLFKDSDFYHLLDNWGLLTDKTAVSNIMKMALNHLEKSKSEKYEDLRAYLGNFLNEIDGGFRTIEKVPADLFINVLPQVEEIPEVVIDDVFGCSVDANFDLIEPVILENPVINTIDVNGLKEFDFHEMTSNCCFENANKKNEFYLLFAYFIYLMASSNNISNLSTEDNWKDVLSEFWTFVLQNAAHFDAEADEWGQFPHFVNKFEELKGMIKNRKIELEGIAIENSINELKKDENRDVINLLEMGNLLSYSISSISPNVYKKLNDVLQKLIGKIDEYKSIEIKHSESKNLKKKRRFRENLEKSENAISRIYKEACGINIDEKAAEDRKQKTKTTDTMKLSENHGSVIDHDALGNSPEKIGEIICRNKELEIMVSEKDKVLAINNYDKSELNRKYQKLKSLLEVKNAKIEAISDLSELPKNLSEAITLIEAIFPERILFLERAKKSAEEASKIPVDIAWHCLFEMANTLHELIFAKSEKTIDVESEFENRTRLELAMTEGKQTKRNSELLNLRKIEYRGKERSIVSHVKCGNKEPKLIRIHFFIDHDDTKIVVGHCGNHLKTHSTRLLK